MIFLEVGQCGLQVGEALFKHLSAEVDQEEYPLNKFSQLLVDTERKVYLNREPSIFKAACVELGSCGRGNNWAAGYYVQQSLLEDILDAHRKLVEIQACID